MTTPRSEPALVMDGIVAGYGGGDVLRGVNFEYEGTESRPISLEVLPPEGASIVEKTDNPTLRFGRLFHHDSSSDLKPQHPDIL